MKKDPRDPRKQEVHDESKGEQCNERFHYFLRQSKGMNVTVSKTSQGYDVTLNGRTVTLPLDMKKTEDKSRGVMIFGNDSKRLEVNAYSNEIALVENGTRDVLVPDDEDTDDERDALVGQFMTALAEAQSGSSRRRSRRSRVNRKTRRSKGKRRQTKRR
jgi:hypothetical protein